MTDEHVRQVAASGNRQPTWRTLYTYTKQDLPCNEVKDLTERVTNQIMTDIKAIIGEIYENPCEAAKLRPRSWKEPHLLLYQKLDGVPPHTGVEMHYDGCDITWNCMLSKSTEYQGGGTYFRCLKKTIRLEQGQVLVHPGELYHKGIDITSGVRSLIVCFLDGFNVNIMDPSSSQEDDVRFQDNVCVYF
jgi:predicted 2-oxoglutarate/Fe(II)-dependent dioxygenase YbiX